MSINVLLVEDNDSLAENIKNVMVSVGEISMITARNLADGMEFMTSENFDIAIFDLRLPDSDINETLNWLKYITKKFPLCVIIVVSAFSEKEIKRKALSCGAKVFIEKTHEVESDILQILSFVQEIKKIKVAAKKMRESVGIAIEEIAKARQEAFN